MGPGDRVAVQVEKSPEAVALYPRLPAGRRGLRAAEHRLHPGGAGLFHHRRRAAGGDLRSRGRGRARADRLGCAGRALHARGERRRAADRRGRGAALGPGGGAARRRGPCGDPLHLRHHRAVQGRDAEPRQPVVERRDAALALGLPARRRADPRAAALPHARAVRGAEPDADERRAGDPAAEVRDRAR